jgi:hypothetical protein
MREPRILAWKVYNLSTPPFQHPRTHWAATAHPPMPPDACGDVLFTRQGALQVGGVSAARHNAPDGGALPCRRRRHQRRCCSSPGRTQVHASRLLPKLPLVDATQGGEHRPKAHGALH